MDLARPGTETDGYDIAGGGGGGWADPTSKTQQEHHPSHDQDAREATQPTALERRESKMSPVGQQTDAISNPIDHRQGS